MQNKEQSQAQAIKVMLLSRSALLVFLRHRSEKSSICLQSREGKSKCIPTSVPRQKSMLLQVPFHLQAHHCPASVLHRQLTLVPPQLQLRHRPSPPASGGLLRRRPGQPSHRPLEMPQHLQASQELNLPARLNSKQSDVTQSNKYSNPPKFVSSI